MNKIIKGDIVKIITGKDKGKQGKVLKVDIAGHRVYVEGANMRTVHQKAGKTKGAENSAIVKIEGPLDISNVMLVVGGTPTKVGFKVEGDKKYRFAKKTGKTIK